MTVAAHEAIAMMLDASDVVETHCPYCQRKVNLRDDHWQQNPGDHPGGYWACPSTRRLTDG